MMVDEASITEDAKKGFLAALAVAILLFICKFIIT